MLHCGKYGIIIPATENADTYFRLFLNKQLTANATYTISCHVSGLKEGSVYNFPLFAQGNASMGVLKLDHNGLCSLTFTMTYGTQTAVTVDGRTVYIMFMDDSSRIIASGQGAITVTNFKLEEGSMRCDVNISIMDDHLDETNSENWGTKIEIKNVNSFSAVRDAINYEIKRQTELKENGTYDEMPQQTRRWSEDLAETIFMRDKVNAIDYKYFVEPNIPKFKLSASWLEEIKNSIPKLASERKEQYIKEYGLSERDAKILVKEKALADYFEKTVNLGSNPQSVANWLISIILGHLNKMDLNIKDLFLTPSMLKGLIDLIDTNKISIKQAKDILPKALEESKDPVKLVSELGITQITDENELTTIINEVIEENPNQLEAYKTNPKLFDYFIGQTMKKTKGKANPALTAKILKKQLEIYTSK